MKFSEFDYQRPSIPEFKQGFSDALKQFEQAADFQAQSTAFTRVCELRKEFDSMLNICHIRHTVDTTDPFYEEENNFFDNSLPTFEDLNNQFYRLLLNSRFRNQLEKKWGKQLFAIADLSLKTFKPEILDDLREENRLKSDYVKVKAKGKIPFRDKTYNLSSIYPCEIDTDRNTRKEASEAKWNFFEKNTNQIEGIYDRLVHLRHGIAQKLGYKNFIETGYARMLRSDYTPEMVAGFRRQILEHVVPLASRLRERQAKRLGLEGLKYYDENYKFPSGNPKPKGSPEWIVENASRMYGELSGETKAFFDFMRHNDLMDLVSKNGKASGGYCTYVSKYHAPYIFSNFTGTSADIDVLTHEAGHAFQVFESRDFEIQEYNWPTYEACEIHSMSMEFFTWPWMQLFFKEDTEKYKFAHLAGSLLFLPYGVSVDEFQHFVYENPDATPEERNQAWRDIERKYLPHRDYSGHEFLESGRFWFKQGHIFELPFYYIDYTLAQICAFQFWIKDRQDHDSAWKDYLRLCKAGGSKSFLELVELANLRSPFEPGCIESVVNEISAWLDETDDSKF